MQSDFLSPIRSRRLSNYIKHLSGLVAYYPLDEVSGSTAYNKAPTTQGTFNGTITGATVGQAGKVGRAYSFDGTGDVLTIADNNALDFTNTFTLSAIINPSGLGTSSGGRIIAKEGGTGFGYDFLFGTNSVIRAFLDNTLYASSNNAVTLSVWQLVSVTFDKDAASDQIKFYVNGASVGNATRATAITANAANLLIGDSSAGTRGYPGLMQHVFLSSSVLSAGQLLKLARIAGLA